MNINKGIELLNNQEYAHACQFFDQYLDINEIEARLYRSLCYFHMQERQNAFDELKKFMMLVDLFHGDEKIKWIHKWHNAYRSHIKNNDSFFSGNDNYKL